MTQNQLKLKELEIDNEKHKREFELKEKELTSKENESKRNKAITLHTIYSRYGFYIIGIITAITLVLITDNPWTSISTGMGTLLEKLSKIKMKK